MPDHKTFRDLEIKDADQGIVAAVFSTFNVIDHDGDVTIPGAFTDGQKVRISAYNHTSWGGSLPVGKGSIRTTDVEAIMEGKFFLDTQHGRDTFQVVKEMDDLQEWSYGFDILESEPGEFDGQRVRYLRRMDVHEVSPVLLGAGIGTRTLAAKSLDELSPVLARKLADELETALKEGRPVLLGDGITVDPITVRGSKLSDRLKSVVTDARQVVDEVTRVTDLRAEEGKSLGEASQEVAAELESVLKELRDVVTPAAEPSGVDLDLDVRMAQEAARFRL